MFHGNTSVDVFIPPNKNLLTEQYKAKHLAQLALSI